MEFFNKDSVLNICSSLKGTVYFDTRTNSVKIDGLDVSFPGEYEMGGVLLEVKEYSGFLFYSFMIEGIHVVIVPTDKFELKESILSFFGDVDVLIIKGSKEATDIYENIEARIIIPYGEAKAVFLNDLGQGGIEEEKIYKLKGELPDNSSEFVNLLD